MNDKGVMKAMSWRGLSLWDVETTRHALFFNHLAGEVDILIIELVLKAWRASKPVPPWLYVRHLVTESAVLVLVHLSAVKVRHGG